VSSTVLFAWAYSRIQYQLPSRSCASWLTRLEYVVFIVVACLELSVGLYTISGFGSRLEGIGVPWLAFR
jgi:hypothetical protein